MNIVSGMTGEVEGATSSCGWGRASIASTSSCRSSHCARTMGPVSVSKARGAKGSPSSAAWARGASAASPPRTPCRCRARARGRRCAPLDEQLHGGRGHGGRAGLAGGQVDHAGPVLEDVPPLGVEAGRVLAGRAEDGAARADRQPHAAAARPVGGDPHGRRHGARGADEGPVHVDADEPDHARSIVRAARGRKPGVPKVVQP